MANPAISLEDLCSPVGLVAGNGSFPLELAENARKRGIEVIAVAHHGETNSELEQAVSSCTWVKLGEFGKLLKTFKSGGVKQVFFAGGITRVKLFGGVKLDLKGAAILSKVRSIKDDVILRGIASEIESEGISVVSPRLLLEESVPAAGVLTRRKLTKDELSDALVGWEAARATGAVEIGQTVVAAEGVVVAVEAVEGTDAALLRAGELAKGSALVAVKLCKPHQDLRFDLPTVGPKTLQSMVRAGVKALVVEAEKTLILDRPNFIEQADAAGLAVVAANSPDQLEKL